MIRPSHTFLPVEKAGGRVVTERVLAISLTDLRDGGPERVAERLATVRDQQPVVADAVCDDDLRVLALALLQVESQGKRLLYRVGPAFVRSRAAQTANPPLDDDALREMQAGSGHGLIAISSHVGLTTRQLDGLRERGGITELELDVAAVLEESTRDCHIAEIAIAAAEALVRSDVVLRTSRELADASLTIARAVSQGLVDASARPAAPFVGRAGDLVDDGHQRSSSSSGMNRGTTTAWPGSSTSPRNPPSAPASPRRRLPHPACLQARPAPGHSGLAVGRRARPQPHRPWRLPEVADQDLELVQVRDPVLGGAVPVALQGKVEPLQVAGWQPGPPTPTRPSPLLSSVAALVPEGVVVVGHDGRIRDPGVDPGRLWRGMPQSPLQGQFPHPAVPHPGGVRVP